MLDRFAANQTDGRITVELRLMDNPKPEKFKFRNIFAFVGAFLAEDLPAGGSSRLAVVRVRDRANHERSKFVVKSYADARTCQKTILARAGELTDPELEAYHARDGWRSICSSWIES